MCVFKQVRVRVLRVVVVVRTGVCVSVFEQVRVCIESGGGVCVCSTRSVCVLRVVVCVLRVVA